LRALSDSHGEEWNTGVWRSCLQEKTRGSEIAVLGLPRRTRRGCCTETLLTAANRPCIRTYSGIQGRSAI